MVSYSKLVAYKHCFNGAKHKTSEEPYPLLHDWCGFFNSGTCSVLAGLPAWAICSGYPGRACSSHGSIPDIPAYSIPSQSRISCKSTALFGCCAANFGGRLRQRRTASSSPWSNLTHASNHGHFHGSWLRLESLYLHQAGCGHKVRHSTSRLDTIHIVHTLTGRKITNAPKSLGKVEFCTYKATTRSSAGFLRNCRAAKTCVQDTLRSISPLAPITPSIS